MTTVRPPRTVGAGPDPNLIEVGLRLYRKYLVSSNLRHSKPKDLTGRSSDFQLTATIIVEGEQGSLHGTGNGRSGKSPGYMVPVATSSGPRIVEGISVIAKSAASPACRVTNVDIGSDGQNHGGSHSILEPSADKFPSPLAGCGKTPFFSEIRNSRYAESKTDHS